MRSIFSGRSLATSFFNRLNRNGCNFLRNLSCASSPSRPPFNMGRDLLTCHWDYVNNDIYALGGNNGVTGVVNIIDKYDIDTQTWTTLNTTMGETRYYHMSFIPMASASVIFIKRTII